MLFTPSLVLCHILLMVAQVLLCRYPILAANPRRASFGWHSTTSVITNICRQIRSVYKQSGFVLLRYSLLGYTWSLRTTLETLILRFLLLHPDNINDLDMIDGVMTLFQQILCFADVAFHIHRCITEDGSHLLQSEAFGLHAQESARSN